MVSTPYKHHDDEQQDNLPSPTWRSRVIFDKLAINPKRKKIGRGGGRGREGLRGKWIFNNISTSVIKMGGRGRGTVWERSECKWTHVSMKLLLFKENNCVKLF